jgi:HEAT repeat protein
LIAVVKENGDVLPAAALDALGHIGPAVTPVLLEVLNQKDDELRTVALDNLGEALRPTVTDAPAELVAEVDRQAKAAVPVIVKILQEGKDGVRQKAAETLGRIGPRAQEAVPALKAALEDKQEAVQQQAREALKKIAPAKPE